LRLKSARSVVRKRRISVTSLGSVLGGFRCAGLRCQGSRVQKTGVFCTFQQGFARLWLGVPKSVKIDVRFSMSKKLVKRAECGRDGSRQQGKPARARGPEKVGLTAQTLDSVNERQSQNVHSEINRTATAPLRLCVIPLRPCSQQLEHVSADGHIQPLGT
jgi:hypothetical protein